MLKVGAVSGDLVVKLALVLGVLGLVAFAVWKFGPDLKGKLAGALDGVNPASENNVVNQGVTAVVSAATGRDETFGGWLYDVTHPDPMNAASAAADTTVLNPVDVGAIESGGTYSFEW